MKDNLLFRTNRLLGSLLLVGFFSMTFCGLNPLRAQVNFVQTTDADFNKGALNNVVVGSNNVYLQFAASSTGTWLTTTVLPQTLTGHKSVSWNDRYAYVLGGYNNTTYSSAVYYATIQSGGITGWTALNPLPVAMKDMAVVVGTNTIYVLGGRDDSQIYNTIYYAAINTDGTLGAWQTSAVTLPVNLWGHTAIYLKGYLYVAGGSSSAAEGTAINNVYYTRIKADNTLAAFSAGTALPAARNKHSMVTYNSKLYVIGGYDNSATKASTVYIAVPGVNGSTGSWSTGTALPVALSNHASVVSNGLITVMAGATSSTLSNTVYYASGDPGSLTWTTSTNVMYDFTRDGAAFTGNGQAYYSGGTNLSGTAIINCRFSNYTLTANYISHGVFVSNPFYELGAERLINSLTFITAYTSPALAQVSYRTAGSDKIWSDWTTLTSTSPITVNQTKQYLQYAVILTGSTTLNATFSEMTLTTPGTQLSGNLNAITTFTSALSPYWATSDISFTAGIHTFQAGTTVLFLPNTGMTVSQANIVCNGTVTDSVKFLYFTTGAALWNGIYFDPSSDVGVSSQFYYTVIANAGNGANNANLYCNQTNEPLLSRCNIRAADGNGIRLGSAHINIQNSVIRGNTENGLYLENSNPTLVTSSLSYNGGAGVFLTSNASAPNYSSSGTVIDHNLCGFRYPSPNYDFVQPNGTPTLTANTYNGIAIDGGDIGSSHRWNAITYDYIMLGTVRIGLYAGACRLTIEPGNTIKGLPGVQLQIGIQSSWGGELYAIGTVDSLITFTSHNGVAGGWNGIWFTDWSDTWGGHSQLDYCVIEKGNDYNYFSENTIQPDLINHTIIRNSAQDGARYSNSFGSITNCQFLNNGRYPLYYMNPQADPVHTNNTYTGNVINRITLSGGNFDAINRTLTNDGVPYYVLNDLYIMQYAGHNRLTINPGVTVEFAEGKKLQVGVPSSWGGDLYAQGTIGSPIIFKPYNNTAGGWGGIYFTDQNDTWGGTSVLEYCTITQAANQNILIENSTQPTLNNCTISNSALHGIVETASTAVIHNCQFLNNNGYPLKYTDWTCNSHLKGNTWTGNNPNFIALSGGDYSSNMFYYYTGIPYHVLGDIRMVLYAGHSRLTLQPGVIMAFEPGVKIQLGTPPNWGGDLWAEGKADSMIVFRPYNTLAGGWAGIYFTDQNDTWGGTSSMKYCRVIKGANYNMLCESSGQPANIENCEFSYSTGNGLTLTNSTVVIKNSTFFYNTQHGIYLDGSSNPTIGNAAAFTNNIYDNKGYQLYNNTANNISARYNYWGTGDSTMIALDNYDKYDNPAKGAIYTGPFAQVPSLTTATTIMTGTLKYANSVGTLMKNAAMVIKDFGGATISSTTSNTSGVYTFSAFTSGKYQMTITPTSAWGGVNATDALGVLNHFAQIQLLTGMKLAAADVNWSHTINGTDALFIMERSTGMITSFPAGNYLYHGDTVYLNSNTVTNNIKMICFGDVDASYVPVSKSTSSVNLVYEGELSVPSNTEFDLPVKVKTGMETGAITLGFYFLQDYFEILGAVTGDGNTNIISNSEDGLFRMAWADLNTMNPGNDETIVILKMKSKDLTGFSGSMDLQLYEYSEFADGLANPYDNVTLSVPQILKLMTGINPVADGISLSVNPNPVSDKMNIEFSLVKSGKINLGLYSLVGNLLTQITETEYSAGKHNLQINVETLKPSIYLLKIKLINNDQPITRVLKIVVSR